MNKALAFLAVFLLSKDMRANTQGFLNVTLVNDLNNFQAGNPGILWEPLVHVSDLKFALGDREFGGKRLLKDEELIFSHGPPQSTQIELGSVKIAYVVLKSENIDQVVLVDGGIGEHFVSLVVKVKDSNISKVITVDLYGYYAQYPHVYYD